MNMRLNRRLSPRRNAVIGAEIVFDGGRSTKACVIRNISDGGAKLEVTSVIGIPNNFNLIIPAHRPHACRVVWRALKELGVAFEVA